MDKAVLIYNGKAIYNGSSAVYLHRGPIMSGYISAEKLRHICRCFQIQIVFLTEKKYFFPGKVVFLHFCISLDVGGVAGREHTTENGDESGGIFEYFSHILV